jgi:hypothetical protein
MSSSRIREDHFPVILEAKIQKPQNYEEEFLTVDNDNNTRHKANSKGRPERQGDFVLAKEIVF